MFYLCPVCFMASHYKTAKLDQQATTTAEPPISGMFAHNLADRDQINAKSVAEGKEEEEEEAEFSMISPMPHSESPIQSRNPFVSRAL